MKEIILTILLYYLLTFQKKRKTFIYPTAGEFTELTCLPELTLLLYVIVITWIVWQTIRGTSVTARENTCTTFPIVNTFYTQMLTEQFTINAVWFSSGRTQRWVWHDLVFRKKQIGLFRWRRLQVGQTFTLMGVSRLPELHFHFSKKVQNWLVINGLFAS